MTAINDIISPFIPRGCYYNINWRNGVPKMADSYNTTNIPDEVAPLGFILATHLDKGSELERQAEIEYLMATQHATRCPRRKDEWNEECCTPTDLAPQWMEMRENGLIANSLNALREDELEAEEAAGTPATDLYGLNLDNTPAFDTPTRAQQALMEWEKRSWIASPWIKVQWDLTDESKVTLKLIGVKHQAGPYIHDKLTKEQKTAILNDFIDQAARENRIPTASQVAEMIAIRDRYKVYGSPKSTQSENPFADWELTDPYREVLHGSDPQTHTRQLETEYAGPWLLGHDDADDEFRNTHGVLIQGEFDTDDDAILLREDPETD